MSVFFVTYGGTRLRVKDMAISFDGPPCSEESLITQTLAFELPLHMHWTRKGRKLMRHMMRNTTPMKLRRVKR